MNHIEKLLLVTKIIEEYQLETVITVNVGEEIHVLLAEEKELDKFEEVVVEKIEICSNFDAKKITEVEGVQIYTYIQTAKKAG